MINLVQMQADAAGALLSDDRLSAVNVVQYRKLRAQSEVDASAIYAVPRNGRAGAGLLVEMPTLVVPKPNLPGPSGQFVVTLVALEEPNMNQEPTLGTMVAAEDIAQIVLEILHGLVIEGVGALYADERPIVPADEFPGLVGYRITLRLATLRPQMERVATPSIAEDALNVTLACTTAEAAIYYTQDGSFPGPGNEAALIYANTFAMSGTVLRWAGYLDGMVGSNVGEAVNE